MDCSNYLSKHLPRQDSYIFREQNSFWFLFYWELALLFFAFLLERFPLLAYGHGVRHYPSQRRRGISHLRENVQLL